MEDERDHCRYSETQEQALHEYATAGDHSGAVPESLVTILRAISDCGVYCYPWVDLKVLISARLDEYVHAYVKGKEEADVTRAQAQLKNVQKTLDGFDQAPFTLQRLCNLVTQMPPPYSNPDKYLFAVEKSLLVGATFANLSPDEYRQRISQQQLCMLEVREAIARQRREGQQQRPPPASLPSPGPGSVAGEDSEEEGKEWEAFATGRKKRPGSGGDGDAEAGKLPGGSGSEDETGGTGEDWMDSDDVRGKRKKHEYKEEVEQEQEQEQEHADGEDNMLGVESTSGLPLPELAGYHSATN